MSKNKGAVPKAKTHFETVPVDVVKQIAAEDVATNPTIEATGEIVAPPKPSHGAARPLTGRKRAVRP